jgi:hypothetical protein
VTPFDAEALVGVFTGGAADALVGVFARGADARVLDLTLEELTAGPLAPVLDGVPDPARARTAERTGMRSPG